MIGSDRALVRVLDRGEIGRTYAVGGEAERGSERDGIRHVAAAVARFRRLEASLRPGDVGIDDPAVGGGDVVGPLDPVTA